MAICRLLSISIAQQRHTEIALYIEREKERENMKGLRKDR